MADWYQTAQNAEKETEAQQHEQSHTDVPQLAFTSRRSPVICRNAAVATSQPLASSIGYDLLRQGANAAETAIAIAATLAVTEPCSTGLGGDMFCLYYNQSTKTVSAINGSGKSPLNLSLDLVKEKYGDSSDRFRDSPLAVTVPGAAAGWEDLLIKHGSGKFTLQQLLQPAIQLAEEGFPVAPITAHHWQSGITQIQKWLQPNEESIVPLFKPNIQAGDVIVNHDMVRVLRDLGTHGAMKGFYQGQTGKAIIDVLQKHGGCMTIEDLQNHKSTYPDPIYAEYHDHKLWQIPPNGQGIAGLIGLTGLQCLEKQKIISSPTIPGTADTYHAMIEMMRLGFADNRTHVADLDHMKISVDTLLNVERIGSRACKMFNPINATIHGIPDASSCTISFQVVDEIGNAISFVNSNFQGFGTGIVPKNCGFTLQNRGYGFSLLEHHPNVIGPSKRPYHTIIPGLITHSDTNELYATISNMGGNMQPQGHFQLTVDLISGGMDPQAAIDFPRFCIADGTQNGVVFLEDGVDEDVVAELVRRGHKIKASVKGHDRSVFGRAQIIKRDRKTGVLWAGSDGRSDGCAMGF